MKSLLYDSRLVGFSVLFPIYGLAFLAGYLTYHALGNITQLLLLLAADAAATLVVFMFSLLIGNSSVYDPYWSVAPILILLAIVPDYGGWNTGAILLFGLVLIWGLRLTWNWSQTFSNWTNQDWRYDMLKVSSASAWPLVSFFGVHLFPTVIVYLAMIPGLLFVQHYKSFNAWVMIGSAICLLAVFLQATADAQMRRFRVRSGPTSSVNREGLWCSIRHPNYLGEILMWWGVFILMLSQGTGYWLAAVGPLAMTGMFVLISIPMMEKRQMQNKPDYAEYRKVAGMLLPKRLWFFNKTE